MSHGVLLPLSTPENDGYLDRVVLEMFKRNNLLLQKEYVAPARALDMATLGLTDGDMVRTESVKISHPDLLQVPESIYSVIVTGVYVDPKIELESWSKFSDYKVGYIRGWQDALRVFDNRDNFLEVSDAQTLLLMLKSGRIDVAFLTLFPAKFLAKELEFDTLYFSKIREEREMYLYLNERNADLIEPLSASLREMKRDGTYQQIMGPYIEGNK
ncbi:ABC transporter substrate-binding protein [Amylibacter ulvae]|uniref:ABC transporter substrate-binding protein n=2 Tax=Paramylibacter ulvae TaxID=1651968 RepID=A0ABQ3D020_9RHOB|nr:ABC transporter substrate-binding protein [Amylibacter ulvae]